MIRLEAAKECVTSTRAFPHLYYSLFILLFLFCLEGVPLRTATITVCHVTVLLNSVFINVIITIFISTTLSLNMNWRWGSCHHQSFTTARCALLFPCRFTAVPPLHNHWQPIVTVSFTKIYTHCHQFTASLLLVWRSDGRSVVVAVVELNC